MTSYILICDIKYNFLFQLFFLLVLQVLFLMSHYKREIEIVIGIKIKMEMEIQAKEVE